MSCFSACETFKCSQSALIHVGKKVYCRWADDDCVGHTCNYAICGRGRLLTMGTCGLSVKRKTTEETAPEALKENLPMNNIKIRGKLLRRFKEDDLI